MDIKTVMQADLGEIYMHDLRRCEESLQRSIEEAKRLKEKQEEELRENMFMSQF